MKNEISTIGIVGLGQMGRGIAQVSAMGGFKTLVFDAFPENLDQGINFIEKQLDRSISKGRIDENKKASTLDCLVKTDSLEGLKAADLVIEAATENKQIKLEIFKKLDELCKKEALLASNTSSIPITEIAAATNRPELVAGIHFMNPVPVMKLVEGIKGLLTSEDTFEAIRSVSEKMGKTFVASEDRPGFAVNRILMPMINEAVYALYEGVATAQDIDIAMKLGTNQPMGPLELADFIGLDTCYAIMQVLHEGFADTKYRPCPLLKQYVVSGRLGRKTKKGFYDY